MFLVYMPHSTLQQKLGIIFILDHNPDLRCTVAVLKFRLYINVPIRWQLTPLETVYPGFKILYSDAGFPAFAGILAIKYNHSYLWQLVDGQSGSKQSTFLAI